MTTVALIADAAFDAVGAAIADAILAVTVSRDTQGAYNVSTGTYAVTTATQTGRAVLADERAVRDIFPAYTIGPRDQMFVIEGIASLQEADRLSAGGKTYAVGPVQDIVGAGAVFYCIAQEVPS